MVTPATSAVLEQCVTRLRSANAPRRSPAKCRSPGRDADADPHRRARATARRRLLHSVTGPGVGVWRCSAPGVKSYRYLRQVTNLAAPASYRGGGPLPLARTPRGHRQTAELLTPSRQLANPAAATPTGPQARESRPRAGAARTTSGGPLESSDDEGQDPPQLRAAHVSCTCGNEFTTRATREELHVEVCSNCHPFYTGRQKLMDTGGRVERFQRRVAKGRLHSAQTRSASRAMAAPGVRRPRKRRTSTSSRARAQRRRDAPSAARRCSRA